VIAKMLGNDDGTMGGIRVNKSGRIESSLQSDKEKQHSRDMQLLLLLHDIEQMEAQLEDKYGENFAENLAAENLDEDTYNRLMQIEDKDERRRQIALALKKGIDNGTIDPTVFDDPQVREWIDARSEEQSLHIDQQNIAEIKDAEATQSLENNSKLSSGLSKIM